MRHLIKLSGVVSLFETPEEGGTIARWSGGSFGRDCPPSGPDTVAKGRGRLSGTWHRDPDQPCVTPAKSGSLVVGRPASRRWRGIRPPPDTGNMGAYNPVRNLATRIGPEAVELEEWQARQDSNLGPSA